MVINNMTNENNGFSFGIGVCLGIIIGGLFAYIIVKQQNIPSVLSTPQSQPSQLEALYMQRLESRLNDEKLNITPTTTSLT